MVVEPPPTKRIPTRMLDVAANPFDPSNYNRIKRMYSPLCRVYPLVCQEKKCESFQYGRENRSLRFFFSSLGRIIACRRNRITIQRIGGKSGLVEEKR